MRPELRSTSLVSRAAPRHIVCCANSLPRLRVPDAPAGTQFEAIYARQAFPCFDEPSLKARFRITVDGVPSGYSALSNMPVDPSPPLAPGRRRALLRSSAASPQQAVGSSVTFLESPPMSTYLLALVVAPLVSVSGMAGRNGSTQVRVLAVDVRAGVG